MSESIQAQLLTALQERIDWQKYNFAKTFIPNPKQEEFFRATAVYPEVMLTSGNQTGKSLSAAIMCSYHLTGEYPDDWEGLRFDKPISMWACGVDNTALRDSLQKLMFGDIANEDLIGTGTIPRHAINSNDMYRAAGVRNLLDYAYVQHKSGGKSLIKFKSYETGREKFQAATIDFCWFDEEPPLDIYTEGMTRTNNGQLGRRGIITFTPLKSFTDVVNMFFKTPSKSQYLVKMTIRDTTHYTEQQKEDIINSYPAHVREARAMGVPVLGGGVIFPVSMEAIREPHRRVEDFPYHWRYICGIDFGWDHPTAICLLGYDADNDIVHVLRAHKEREMTPLNFIYSVKSWYNQEPVSWPHDGYQHDKGSGKQLSVQYAEVGFKMLARNATFEDGSISVEAGIMQMLQRMDTGRFKVDETLEEFWDEFRMYHRENGKIVKINDDILCLHGDTHVVTNNGISKISDLVNTIGKVINSNGEWVEYKNCRKTRENAETIKLTFSDGSFLICTPDHKIRNIDKEWVMAKDMLGLKCYNGITSSKHSKAWITSYTKTENTVNSTIITGMQEVSFCIGKFIKTIMEKFLKSIIFIIKTITQKITIYQTLNVYAEESTFRIIKKDIRDTHLLHSKLKKYGLRQKKERRFLGIKALKTPILCMMLPLQKIATIAEMSLQNQKWGQIAFVPINANQLIGDQWGVITKKENAKLVVNHTKLTSIQKLKRAAGNVAGRLLTILNLKKESLVVTSIIKSKCADVYCMEVPFHNEFMLDNGLIVHNCATRYAFMMLREAENKSYLQLEEVRSQPNRRTGQMGY